MSSLAYSSAFTDLELVWMGDFEVQPYNHLAKKVVPKTLQSPTKSFSDENKDHLIDSHSTLIYFDGMYNLCSLR